jgi:hypothetical protein
MLTLSKHFDLLLSKIEPPEDRRIHAQQIPADVRNYLKEHDELITVMPHSRLAGSYARHTAIGDIKDVDVLILVHNDYVVGKPSVVLSILSRVLEGLPAALGTTGEVEFRHQRRSIHVCFANLDFHLDIVPVAMPKGIDEPLQVPDRTWQKWCETHPLGYQTWLSRLNEVHGGKVVPLIKIVKYWKDCQFVYKRPKSYWLECLIVRHINKGWVATNGLSYAELFTNLLASIYDRFEDYLDDPDAKPPRIPDPMLGNNVAFNWERSHFEGFMARVKESRNWAQRALALGDDQTEAAELLWQKVFDTTFPTTAEVEAKAYIEAWKTGNVFVTPEGRVLPSRPVATPVVQSPKHRFFGDDSIS